MVPVPGKTCLGLEYFCFEGDGLWASRDDELIALAARSSSSSAWRGARRRSTAPSSGCRRPIPIYDAAYRAPPRRRTRDFIDPIPNLHTVGRNGMHKYNNQDHSMLTAMMTLWNMQGASHDVWYGQHRLRVPRGAEGHGQTEPGGGQRLTRRSVLRPR